MSFLRVAAPSAFFLSLFLLLGLTAAHAQALRNVDGPANFPPSSFKGKQFVDNNGCAFVRAGIDGRVNWVPRVTRSRKLLCGMQPTFAGQEARVTQQSASSQVTQIVPKATPAAPAPQPAARVAEAAPAPAPAARTVVRQPVAQAPTRQQPARQAQVAAAPAPRVVRVAPQAVRPAVQPQQVRRIQPAPQPAVRTAAKLAKPAPQAKPTATRQKTCVNFTGISAQYAGTGSGVRCGPQGQSPSAGAISVQPKAAAPRKATTATAQPQRTVTRSKATGQINASGSTRVIPRHVYEEQQRSNVKTTVPKGYRKVWEDDRLNTKRAHMTVEGIRQSDLIWTRTLPRKLYVKDTGRVVNNLFPELRYPYTSMADQNAAMGLTTSSRSKPAAATAPKAAAKGRYVQVGMFANPANAQRAAQRIAAAGLPARLGTLKKGSKSYRLVLAGPFASGQINAAVAKARSAGFADAYVR